MIPSALPPPCAVLFVANVQRLARFYRELAAMGVVHEDEDHVVLEIAGLQLVIHALRGAPEPVADVAPKVREDSYWKLCLPVASIAAGRAIAASLGGHIAPPSREWEARGFRACDGHDPESNVIQLRELAA
ncbi:hypothetical protein J7U46_07455 [Pelomonas sp. V22]|uniref:VOC family protein n=1 Tax=Pelomonas sp. V22 TaxID=2822139 RepID=UPI0024A7AAA9|nr:VOC family protein [Pelomonas sp. V22]MDI4632881.1 hypothetical protein [Pelomonas sp. V22]